MKTTIVGQIEFYDKYLNVYGDLNEPLFLATEVAQLIDYSIGNTSHMLNIIEKDEKVLLSVRNTTTTARGNSTPKWFITELGLYSVLSQSRKPIARVWRRVVHTQLIDLRKSKNYDIVQQFDEWNDLADILYFDELTNRLMVSVTIRGGDVDQIPYEEFIKGE